MYVEELMKTLFKNIFKIASVYVITMFTQWTPRLLVLPSNENHFKDVVSSWVPTQTRNEHPNTLWLVAGMQRTTWFKNQHSTIDAFTSNGTPPGITKIIQASKQRSLHFLFVMETN
jgi:hypothetical protein